MGFPPPQLIPTSHEALGTPKEGAPRSRFGNGAIADRPVRVLFANDGELGELDDEGGTGAMDMSDNSRYGR